MPVNVVNVTSRVRVRLVDSIDGNGNERLSTRTYSNVRPDAEHEAVYNVMLEMLGLQEKPVSSLIRVQEEELRG